jgi:hypothetical protein
MGVTHCDDAMIEIARLVSRSEALTVQAMLAAAGIDCRISGLWHSGLECNMLALGGLRLAVPACHYDAASAVIREAITEPPGFNFDQRRRTVRFLGVVALVHLVPAAVLLMITMDQRSMLGLLSAPLIVMGAPVPPQGRGDWYLAPLPS